MPSVSAYIIGRNCADTLGEAIESVLMQTRPVQELWYVDDASEDDSVAVAREYGNDRVGVLVNQTHQGIVKSRNLAAAQCSGDWIAVLDADDVWAPNKIEQQITHLDAHPEVVALGGHARIEDEDGEELGLIVCPLSDEAIKSMELVHNCFVHSTVLFRRDLFDAAGGYAGLPVAEDYDLLLRLSEKGVVGNLNLTLATHRISLRSVTSTRKAEQIRCAKLAKAKARERRGVELDVRTSVVSFLRDALAPALLSSPHVHWGVHQLVHGDAYRGRKLLRKGARADGASAAVAKAMLLLPPPVFRLLAKFYPDEEKGP